VLEQRIVAIARTDPTMRRLATIPGIGPLTARVSYPSSRMRSPLSTAGRGDVRKDMS
jgi:transposase